MRLKSLALCALSFILCLSPFCAAAENNQAITDGVLDWARGDLDVQAWVNSVAAQNAGSAMDGYIINLNQQPNALDYSAYVQAAAEKLKEGAISNPSARMRCALALISCGAGDAVPTALPDESIGKLGIMSYIYGLHLLNNGAESALWTVDALVEKLLSMQKEDGGWAVMGDYGDVDVTAMCLQALVCVGDAPEPEIRAAMDRAVAFLSEKQLSSGGYASTGHENSESTAQVLIAAASLGIDPAIDARFSKDGVSAVDALLRYRMPGGGFAHLPDDTEENDNASLQALQAFTSLSQIGQPYYSLNPAHAGALAAEERNSLPTWKLYAFIGIGMLTVAGAIFALIRRHGRVKQLIAVLALSALLAASVCMIDVESASGYYNDSTVDAKAVTGEVYLSIRCDTVAGLMDDGSTPEDGVILDRTALPCHDGDTVFDILTAAARKFEIQMEHEGGTGDMAYVNGINFLYEYAHGELSGWMYAVNGDYPSVGCGAYRVQPGDEISWQYTLNIGEDLKSCEY